MKSKRALVFGVSEALVVGALVVGAGCKSGGEEHQPAPQPAINPGPCLPGQDPAKDNCYEDKSAPPAADAAPDLDAPAPPININPGPDDTLVAPLEAADMAADQAEEEPSKQIEPIKVNPGPTKRPPNPKPEPKPNINTGPASPFE